MIKHVTIDYTMDTNDLAKFRRTTIADIDRFIAQIQDGRIPVKAEPKPAPSGLFAAYSPSLFPPMKRPTARQRGKTSYRQRHRKNRKRG